MILLAKNMFQAEPKTRVELWEEDWSAPDGSRKCIWIKRLSVSRFGRHVEMVLPKKFGLGQRRRIVVRK